MLRKRWFRWLIPGLNIKRWLALYSLGVGLLIIGISLLFNYQWLSYIEDIVLAYSYSLTGYYNYNVLILVGADSYWYIGYFNFSWYEQGY